VRAHPLVASYFPALPSVVGAPASGIGDAGAPGKVVEPGMREINRRHIGGVPGNAGSHRYFPRVELFARQSASDPHVFTHRLERSEVPAGIGHAEPAGQSVCARHV
jgi:hypothetical protein